VRAARVVVEPLGLVNKTGVWYLVTQPAVGRTRVYRVGRIASAALLDQAFTRPAGFDLAAAWAAWSMEFRTSRPRVEVTLRVSDLAFGMLPEIFGDQVQQHMAAASAPDASGWRTLRLPFEHPHAACHRLLGFGAQVEVLAPAAVRALLIETAAAAYSVYCKGDEVLTSTR
jgi:predicted DNA-binding transcriptional regulator YafY